MPVPAPAAAAADSDSGGLEESTRDSRVSASVTIEVQVESSFNHFRVQYLNLRLARSDYDLVRVRVIWAARAGRRRIRRLRVSDRDGPRLGPARSLTPSQARSRRRAGCGPGPAGAAGPPALCDDSSPAVTRDDHGRGTPSHQPEGPDSVRTDPLP